MCSACCGRLRIDGRAVRGDRECCPKRRDNVGGPAPELIAPVLPGLPVVPGVRRARDQPWWMGSTDTGIGFLFFFARRSQPDTSRRSGSLTTNGSRAADLDEAGWCGERTFHRTVAGWPLSTTAGEPEPGPRGTRRCSTLRTGKRTPRGPCHMRLVRTARRCPMASGRGIAARRAVTPESACLLCSVVPSRRSKGPRRRSPGAAGRRPARWSRGGTRP